MLAVGRVCCCRDSRQAAALQLAAELSEGFMSKLIMTAATYPHLKLTQDLPLAVA